MITWPGANVSIRGEKMIFVPKGKFSFVKSMEKVTPGTRGFFSRATGSFVLSAAGAEHTSGKAFRT